MNNKQARQLLPGTVVMWNHSPNDLGTVVDTKHGGILIKWSVRRAFLRVKFSDMMHVSLYQPNEVKP